MELDSPKVMGILNITEDSFYKDSRYSFEDDIRRRIEKMISEGVDIIDIGGCSTRPDSQPVSEDEELKRVSLGCGLLRNNYPDFPLSIDTFRSRVAKMALEVYNADIINDVSGGEDEEMIDIIASFKVPYVLTYNTKERNFFKSDITADAITFLSKKLNLFHKHGVNDVILDPGFGFSKSINENFILLNELEEFVKTGYPVLVGLSRKSMIYRTLETGPEGSLEGTVALNSIALYKGAHILRVHDVKIAKDIVKLITTLKKEAL